ncbi:MAG: hypothetical protein LBS03_07045 [Bacteroidales bacterium]|nr:hypothetical protein [Bacteroidales bacterium]
MCGASRIYNEITTKDAYSFEAKSPAETANVSRLYLPQKPEKVTVDNKVTAEYVWDELSHTCLIKFDNNPDGVWVSVE